MEIDSVINVLEDPLSEFLINEYDQPDYMDISDCEGEYDHAASSLQEGISCSHAWLLNSFCLACGQNMGHGYGLSSGYMQQGLRLSVDKAVQLREIVTQGFLSKKGISCSHAWLLNSLCIACGRNMGHGYGLSVGYMQPGLRLSVDKAVQLREIVTRRFLSKKKLLLVLDLDHTLLHTIAIKSLLPVEKYLEQMVVHSPQQSMAAGLFYLELKHYHTNNFIVKFRPFVREFLREASTMFNLCIYTKGNRDYANKIAKLLDPGNKYFGSRVISREDCTVENRKNLDVVLGQESSVVIIDDTIEAWPKHRDNLLPVEKYVYFGSPYPVEKIDECKNRGQLKQILGVLKAIHEKYFDREQHGTKDVRQIIQSWCWISSK